MQRFHRSNLGLVTSRSNHDGRIVFQKLGSIHCTEIGCKHLVIKTSDVSATPADIYTNVLTNTGIQQSANTERTRGVARIFQRGGHTVSKQGLFNYGQDIVLAFSPPVVGCLVEKNLAKGGVTGTLPTTLAF